MRTSSMLSAFVFLGIVAAGVVPDIAGRDTSVADNKEHGGPHHPVSSIRPHPSGHPVVRSSEDQSKPHDGPHSPADGKKAKLTSPHMLYPIPSGTDHHVHHSAAPRDVHDHAMPSGHGHGHHSSVPGARPTGYSGPGGPHAARDTAAGDGIHSYYRGSAPRSDGRVRREDPEAHRSGMDQHTRDARPSGARGRESGSPTGVTAHPHHTAGPKQD